MLTGLYSFLTSADTSGLDADRAAAIATVRSMVLSGSPQIIGMYPDLLDEGAPLPALVYQGVGNGTEHTLDGDSDGLYRARVQIDVYAMTRADRERLGKALRDSLDGLAMTLMGDTEVNVLLWDNEIDSFESARRQYRRTLDFLILHN